VAVTATISVAFQSGADTWLPVDYSAFRDHLASLPAGEQPEQLRDWAIMAAWMDAAPRDRNPGDSLFTLQPLRLDALHSVTQKRVGPTRWLPLANERVLAVIPEGTKDILPLLGKIADEYRVESSAGPREVLVYVYRFDESRSELAIRKAPAVAGTALFDKATGYYEEDVHSIAELQTFLARNPDLVMFRNVGDHIRLGGRAHALNLPQLVTVQDLAVISKAGLGLGDMVRYELQRRGLRETYEARVNEFIAKVLKEQPSILKTYADFDSLRQEIYARVPYEDFLKRQVDGVLQENPPGLGFSLDPRTNFDQIAGDLRSAAAGNDSFFTKWLLPIEVAEVERQEKSVNGLFESLLSNQLNKGSQKEAAVADNETGLASLIGLVASAPAAGPTPRVPAAATADTLLAHLLEHTPIEVENLAREIVDGIRAASHAKSAELLHIADALSKKDLTPLLDLERYLEADIVGITIRSGAPKYRVLDLQEMLAANGFDLTVDGVYGPKTGALIRSYQEREHLNATGIVNVETWKALLASAPEKETELSSVHELLQVLKQHRDYQCARYDGRFSGTEVGMTLYYTDLVMKLWGFANKEQKPLVAGFVPETQYEIAPIYKDDILHHPSTRGWLGGRLEAVGFHDDGAAIHFAPVATRLYNASSSYLFPGAEVPANFMAERFSSWWNNHYSDVADFEPQYHRLNQLMKWAAVLEGSPQGLLAPLTGLAALEVQPAGRFDEWWARHKELRVHWDVRFLSIAGERTECMAIVTSEPFHALGGLCSLSGGVTLPKAEELADKRSGDLKRTSIADARDRLPGVNYREAVMKDGEISLPTIDKARQSRSREGAWSYDPPKNQRFEGRASSIPAGRITTRFQSLADGIAIESQLGATLLDQVKLSRSPDGFALTGEEGPQMSAARHLASPADATPESGGGPWMRIALSRDEFLMRASASDQWTLVSPAKAAGAGGVRVGVGTFSMNVAAIAALQITARTNGLGWLAIRESDFGSRDTRATLLASPPDAAKPVRLVMKGVSISAKVDSHGVYFERKAGSFDDGLTVLKTIVSSFDEEDLAAVVEASQRPQAAQFARRSATGELVLAGFGGGGGGGGGLPPATTAFFDDLIPPDGKFIRGILLRNDQNIPLRVTEGLIELPAAASMEMRDRARRLSHLVESKPQIGERIEKLASIAPDDLIFFENHRESRSANYIEFRAVSTQAMGATALLDLQFTPQDPLIVFRKGDQVSTISVPNAAEAIAARDYVDKAARGEVGLATVADLRTQSRPYFDLLESVRKTIGAAQFLTKETGEINAETVYRIGGGDPSVSFPKDIADVATSVAHLREPVPLSVSHSVVASTVSLNDPGFLAANAAAGVLDSYLARLEAPVSYEAFVDLLLDENLSQISLVVRYRDGGLVFSDRWISLSTIAADVADIPQKDLLHLITNGGQDVVGTFADSGNFKRVMLTRFSFGDQPSFEHALHQLTELFNRFAIPIAVWSPAEWEAAKSGFGEAAPLFESLSKPVGTMIETDVSTLMKRGQERRIDWSERPLREMLDRVRQKLKAKTESDADTVIESVNAAILGSIPDASTRPATTALQGVIQTKND
jgi:hypothetical protein